jgi:hypothetical protein
MYAATTRDEGNAADGRFSATLNRFKKKRPWKVEFS